MVIGILQIEINIPGISSLKSKRSVLKGIYAAVKKEYNVSVSELGAQDQLDKSHLGFAQIGTSRDVVHASLTKLADHFAASRTVDLAAQQIEFL